MLHIIVSDHKPYRNERVAEIISAFTESEIISVDDALVTLADLEQFLFPSLFSVDVPVVHGRFFFKDELDPEFVKKLSASPTVFIFEELALPAASITTLKKSGASVYVGEKQKANKPVDDIFAATLCITAKDKKSRWLAYRSAVEKQPIEAILGILYWKIRTLASKGAPGNSYEKLYRDLLSAQSRAWRSGAPLEALIEKIILTQ